MRRRLDVSKVRLLVEFLVVLLGSVAAGVGIGTVQHFVAFGVWGYGFGKGPLQLAAFEGGIVGATLGIPTGLIVYYADLRRHLTLRRAAIVLGGSLVGGCALGAAMFWVSAFITPVLTIGISSWARQRA
jgi:hypothetical protein